MTKHTTHLDRMLDEVNLVAAWHKVRKNAGAPGIDGQTIDTFGVNVLGRLQTLREHVLRSEYRPAPLHEIGIAKPDGGERRLAIPTVRDRVLQTAAAGILGPELERAFEHASYAYRAGRSVAMAVARVAHYRDQGYHWVVDTDIQSFFDEIDHTLLLAKLRRTLADHSSLSLIELWLAATVQPQKGLPRLLTRGVPQGSPISPLLANLYLDDMDEALLDQNMRLVRFADDFLILCRDQSAAEQALDFTEDVVETLKLKLKPEKTRITHFEQGFSFLGVNFIRNLMRAKEPGSARWVIPDADTRQAAASHDEDQPQVEPEHPPTLTEPPQADNAEPAPDLPRKPGPSLRRNSSLRPLEPPPTAEADTPPDPLGPQALSLDPLLRTLHVSHSGHTLLKESERVVVRNKHDSSSLPLNRLDQIILQGNQLVSTALLRHAAQTGLAVHITDHAGRPVKGLHTGRHNLHLLRRQFACEQDAELQLMLARAFVDGKIHNQRLLLRRQNRRRNDPEIDLLEHAMLEMQDRHKSTEKINQLRGLEGAAAHRYFKALQRIVDESWQFPGRRKNPPTDPFNVLLSYGYGVLFSTLHTLAARIGLHPELGHLHRANGRHPALISDLMEEFRAPIVDTAALSFIKQCQPGDFEWQAEGEYPCRLTETTRRRYLQHLQNRMRAQLVNPRNGQRQDYHRLLHYQAWHYAQVMLGEADVYHPFKGK